MIDGLVSEKLYTVEEYLALEEKATFKYEYYNGKIIPVPGGSFIHNTIATNIATALKIALKGKEKNTLFPTVILRYKLKHYTILFILMP